MPDKSKFTQVFQRLIDAPVASMNALLGDPAAFEAQAIAAEDSGLGADAGLFNQQMLGFLLFDQKGARLPLALPDWLPDVHDFASLEAQALQRSARLMAVDVTGRTLHLLWAPAAETNGWNLPQSVRQIVDMGQVDRLAVITGAGNYDGPIDAAAAGFALTDLERRVVVAIVRTGNGRVAAAELGLNYTTVREAIASATKRMRQPNMPALVHTIVNAAFGILPGDAASSVLLADMLQLSERQARIALLVATGSSREVTAAATGVSIAVVRKELEFIYGSTGISSAAELSRLIIELQALSVLARATDGAPGFLNPAIEPSRFFVRDTGREIIGWSDYGPSSGKPVLVVHSNWSCREVPRTLLRALHARGWRPIAIDRPGFGSTHPGRSTANDPFGQAIADTLLVLDRAGIDRVAVVARAGAQFVHALKVMAPDRLGPVVLVSPTVPTPASSSRRGLMGVMKDVFQRPRLIELYFRVISSQMTIARLEQLTRAATAGSAVDTALCDDPEFIRDRFRAVRPFATGNLIGGIHEQILISTGSYAATTLTVNDWVVIQGDDDSHNNFAEVEHYWRPMLPTTDFMKISDGGRYLTSSHPEFIVNILENISSSFGTGTV